MSDQGYDRAVTSISDLPRENRVRRIGNSQESVGNDTISLVSRTSSICGRSAEQPKIFESRLNNDILFPEHDRSRTKEDDGIFSLHNPKLKSNDSIENIEPISE
jgi:hypothetical protein